MKYAIGKSSGCFIDEESVIKIFGIRGKGIKAARGSYKQCWLREVNSLMRLRGSLHFPQLIESHKDHLGLRMTNAGDSLFNTWHEHDLTLYIDQIYTIADTLERANIQYFYPGIDPNSKNKSYAKFPLSNFCIDDGELSLIDFELANPIDSEARLTERLQSLYDNYNKDDFVQSMINALQNPRQCYESELKAKLKEEDKLFNKIRLQNPRKVFKSMTTFTTPSAKVIKDWKQYQKRYGMGQAVDRVERMRLREVCRGKLLDVGCNDGYITKLVSEFVNSAVGLEPFVEPMKNLPANMTWVVKEFNEFCEENETQFDTLLSLAVSIQLRDYGKLTEQEIVDRYYDLLAPGGIVVHETQKLENRPRNQEHTHNMITAFKTKFEQLAHGQARPSGQREYYHFRKA